MGKGASEQVIGYEYAVGMHMVLCHGPVDEVCQIFVGDKSAWVGSLNTGAQIFINAPQLFGGEDREGGVHGYVDFMFGDPDQPCNDYLVDRIGGGPPVGDPNRPSLSGGVVVLPDGTVTNPDGTPIPGYNFGIGLVVTWRAAQAFVMPAVGATVDIYLGSIDQPPQDNSVLGITNGFNAFVGKVVFYDPLTLTVRVENTMDLVHPGAGMGDDTVLTVYIPPTADELASVGPQVSTSLTSPTTVPSQGSPVTLDFIDASSFPFSTFVLFANGLSAWIGHVTARRVNEVDVICDNILQGDVGDPQGAFETKVLFYNYPGADVVLGVAGVSGYIPAFRGVLSLVLRQTWVSAISAYIKPWAVRVRRSPKALDTGNRSIDLSYTTSYSEFTGLTAADVTAGTDGNTVTTITTDGLGNTVITQVTTNPSLVITAITVNGTTTTTAIGVVRAANPAAIIAECLTNTQWGLGIPSAQLDLDSFNAAGATLLTEEFGMCLTWSDQTRMEDFINQILRVINASRFEDPATGKIGIRLIRDDYDIEDLPVFDETNVVDVASLLRPDPSDIINQVTVGFIDRATGAIRSITAHNGASITQLAGVNPTTIDMPGIPTMDIAKRVAVRELATYSRGMAGLKLIVNRSGKNLKAGDVLVLNWAPRQVSGMVLRISEIDYGLLTDNRISISAVEDFFSFPATTYVGDTGSGWVDPNKSPKKITQAFAFEVPYYIFQTEVISDLDSSTVFPDGYAFLGSVAARPQSISTSYSMFEDSSGTYAEKTNTTFTPNGRLTAEIDDRTEFINVVWYDLDNLKINSYAFLDDEIVAVIGINGTLVTVLRGVMDTVPVKHVPGTVLWMAGGNRAVEKIIFLAGQSLNVRLQNRTTSGAFPVASCATLPITFVGRAERPYPPGNIQIDGVYRPATPISLGVVTWAHRNRLTQTAGLVSQTDGSITPEVGTTYTIVVKERALSTDPWVVTETVAGIAGTTYTPTLAAMQFMRVEISSVRDGLSSYQAQIVEVTREGFGVNFGNLFGE